MAFSFKRLLAVIQGKVNYSVTVDGVDVFFTRDLMAATQQLDYLRKEHPVQDVQIKIMEA